MKLLVDWLGNLFSQIFFSELNFHVISFSSKHCQDFLLSRYFNTKIFFHSLFTTFFFFYYFYKKFSDSFSLRTFIPFCILATIPPPSPQHFSSLKSFHQCFSSYQYFHYKVDFPFNIFPTNFPFFFRISNIVFSWIVSPKTLVPALLILLCVP